MTANDRPSETADDRPSETEAERDDRNLAELLQELRVAGLGVQMIFGFLLAIPFASRFSALGPASGGFTSSRCCSPPSPRPCWSGRSPTTGWCSAAA